MTPLYNSACNFLLQATHHDLKSLQVNVTNAISAENTMETHLVI